MAQQSLTIVNEIMPVISPHKPSHMPLCSTYAGLGYGCKNKSNNCVQGMLLGFSHLMSSHLTSYAPFVSVLQAHTCCASCEQLRDIFTRKKTDM